MPQQQLIVLAEYYAQSCCAEPQEPLARTSKVMLSQAAGNQQDRLNSEKTDVRWTSFHQGLRDKR
jgi:hypothetical protein